MAYCLIIPVLVQAGFPIYKMLIMLSLSFFILVVAAVYALHVETPKKKLEVARGDNASLPCSFQTSVSPQRGDIVYWTKMSTEVGNHNASHTPEVL